MTRPLALVDTNVVSYIFRRDTRALPYPPILAGFRHLAISFQTLAELRFWARKRNWERRRIADLALYLEPYSIVLASEDMTERWAQIRHQRERAGRRMEPEDAWIAATAVVIGCPLVTHDAGDFSGIDGLEVITAT